MQYSGSPILKLVNAVQWESHILLQLPTNFDGDGVVPPVAAWTQLAVAQFSMAATQRTNGFRFEAIKQVAEKGQLPTFEPMLWTLWKAYRAMHNAAIKAPPGPVDAERGIHRERMAGLFQCERDVSIAIERLWFALPAIDADAPQEPEKIGASYSRPQLAEAAVIAHFKAHPDSDPTAEEIGRPVGLDGPTIRNAPAWKLHRRGKQKAAVDAGDAADFGDVDSNLECITGRQERGRDRRSLRRR